MGLLVLGDTVGMCDSESAGVRFVFARVLLALKFKLAVCVAGAPCQVPSAQRCESASSMCWETRHSKEAACAQVPEEYGGGGADVLMAAVHWEEQS